ncbi:MAG: hypothetical protein IT289_00515 [Oligoflexia bacterium]|nr:hypothetical protein [Oligoflexia bacterium]
MPLNFNQPVPEGPWLVSPETFLSPGKLAEFLNPADPLDTKRPKAIVAMAIAQNTQKQKRPKMALLST